VSKEGEHYYNFWRDAQHVRGIWRRTTLAQYQLAEPAWETVIDLDQLAAGENENWVWGGATCLYPKGERCLISLSRGGGDAKVVREPTWPNAPSSRAASPCRKRRAAPAGSTRIPSSSPPISAPAR
jgi:hypothetical protein